MKPRTPLTVLSLATTLGLLLSGCVTNSGGGGLSPGMTAQLDADANADLQSR